MKTMVQEIGYRQEMSEQLEEAMKDATRRLDRGAFEKAYRQAVRYMSKRDLRSMRVMFAGHMMN